MSFECHEIVFWEQSVELFYHWRRLTVMVSSVIWLRFAWTLVATTEMVRVGDLCVCEIFWHGIRTIGVEWCTSYRCFQAHFSELASAWQASTLTPSTPCYATCRRMFPVTRVSVSGIDANAMYSLLLLGACFPWFAPACLASTLTPCTHCCF